MTLTKKTAKKWISSGRARYNGNAINDGWEFAVIDDLDTQRTLHVRLGRNTNDPVMMGSDAFVFDF